MKRWGLVVVVIGEPEGVNSGQPPRAYPTLSFSGVRSSSVSLTSKKIISGRTIAQSPLSPRMIEPGARR